MKRVVAVITLAFFLLSALLTPSASLHIHDQAKKGKILGPTFPRKLRITEQVSVVERAMADSKPDLNKQKQDVLLGDTHGNKEQVHGNKGTRQEWSTMEGTDDEPNLFTMDYSRVRRRRPIHNKSVPVGP